MKTPEQRKTESEILLHKRGIRINVMLPLIESDEEVLLRSPDDVWRRMLALWAVTQSQHPAQRAFVQAYLQQHGMNSWLSTREQQLVKGNGGEAAAIDAAGYAAEPATESATESAAAAESLFFIAWCAGVIKRIEMPSQESSLKPLTAMLPQAIEDDCALRQAIRLRSKDDIMSWADLLYRLHWAARHARLSHRPTPGNLNHCVLESWHKAVNWMIRYEDEDDWDRVGTDT
ncbi:hypothetical protein BH11PSE11_BH11PSE11_26370 [soil metagenome]